MIRNFRESDIDSIMKIWLEVNIQAHYFIEEDYWKHNYDNVKSAILQAEIYVYEQNDRICGFIGLMEDYIAGIFVSHECQSNGIGKQLLDRAKNKHDMLELNVYRKNERAVKFYMSNGFSEISESIDENTSETELCMEWKRSCFI